MSRQENEKMKNEPKASFNNFKNIFCCVSKILPLFLDKDTHFLPRFLVLGSILDDFASFLPLLLDFFITLHPQSIKRLYGILQEAYRQTAY